MTTLPRAASAAAAPALLHVLSAPLSDAEAERAWAGPAGDDALVWSRRGEGLLGLGVAAHAEATGDERIAELNAWFTSLSAAALVEDDVRRPGSGPTAFGSFAFSRASAVPSRLIVPEIVLGRDGDTAWITWATPAAGPTLDGALARLAQLRATAVSAAPARATAVEPGRITPEAYVRAVAGGVGRIRADRVDKIVLSRDAVVRLDAPVAVEEALRELSSRYLDCWTYSMDGLFGATPEMLVQVLDGTVRARVLAGTMDRAVGRRIGDEAAKASLVADDKQRHEHRFAIDSLTQTLGPLVRGLEAPEEPFVLQLPNVWHLASDVRADLAERADGTRPGALDLVEVVHPTAAVCGTPRTRAGEIIRELEAADRGRFAGPVGWVDAAGNGEFGIALRGGTVEPDGAAVRIWAGCGIVADSVPESELAETWAKMRPMLQALGAPEQP